MKHKTTTEQLMDQYNVISQRPTVQDPKMLEIIFKSTARSLRRVLPGDTSVKILDVGCGEGALLAFLRWKGYSDLAGFDLSSQNIAICHSIGLNFVTQFDALRLSEYQDDFDVIFALDLIEHLPKERVADFVKQLFRLLNPGGYIVVQTPNMGCVTGLFTRYNDLSHEFGLTENTARSLIALGGFEFGQIEALPCWNATSVAGYIREIYLRIFHFLYFLMEGASRPRIASKNLLIKAVK